MIKKGNLLINEDILEALDDYHIKSKIVQQYHYEKNPKRLTEQEFKDLVDDDLVLNVPIYDVLHRRYAAFSSLLEALWYGEKDPKNNGVWFTNFERFHLGQYEWILLFYLFRLCGSGINYKPKNSIFQDPRGTHGFGNFWIIDEINLGRYSSEQWMTSLSMMDKPFTNNKGYLLPQFSFKYRKSGHLKHYILCYSQMLVRDLLAYLKRNPGVSIYEVTDYGNDWLNQNGFKKQNFVLTAFAMDIAEYYPNLVNPNSKVYAGTNATKCIKQLFKKAVPMKEFDFINEALEFLAYRYDAFKYDVEDSRACDPIRYFQEYQSKDHIAKNNGVVYKNNSILKEKWGLEKYYEWANNLK